MAEKKNFKKFVKSLFYAFSAQGVSTALGIMMTLFVSKALGVADFGYWQLFIMYTNYVGLTHFGIMDGIYLRLGGSEYKDLNFPVLASQFWIMIIEQAALGVGVLVFALVFEQNPERRFVWFMVALYMLTLNADYYFGYIFQATNNTAKYSLSVMLDKLAFTVYIAILLFWKIRNYKIYVGLFVWTKVMALVYSVIAGKEIIFTRLESLKKSLREAWYNIKVGIQLLLANMASLFILGSGRMVVDGRWGIEVFGKFSFSISLSNFVLNFIGQISMVMFPALRRVDRKNLEGLYSSLRDGLGIALNAVYLIYIPMKILLALWLPQYKESLYYLAIILPVCTFDGKMQILCNTYLKVLRKEKILLILNIASVVICLSFSLLGAYVFGSLYFVIGSMVCAVAFRSIAAELYLARLMHASAIKGLAAELALSALFVGLSLLAGDLLAFGIYCAAYIIYLLFSRAQISELLKTVKLMLKGRSEAEQSISAA
ncbi:MAG: hypothetical protein LBC56_05315 [Oscillospiraceae bacterium]|nr:hypothetical protein [Oscillospiraceae bacterium]